MSSSLDRSALDSLRRSCVECGLCLPTCATYLATGDEAQSPRGRLLLLGEVLAGRLEADQPEIRQAFSQCLGCLACTATCPSGVSVELLDTVRVLGTRPPGGDRRRLITLLDRRLVLRTLRYLGVLIRGSLRCVLGTSWRRRLTGSRLARMLGTLPLGPGPDTALVKQLDELVRGRAVPAPVAGVAKSVVGRRIAFFSGCADEHLLPHTARRLRETLTDLGCELVEPEGQDCCGALANHLEARSRAAKLQRRNQVAFAPHLDSCDQVVVAAAGCGRELSIQPGELAAKVVDAVTLLAELAPADLGPVPLRVAVHDPCHARHGLGVVTAPRRLLDNIPGLEVLEPDEAEVCCGSAGVYGVQHPALSAVMGRRKAEVLAATGCDLVVTTNPGCLGQIADGLALVAPTVPILPLSDLIWYARRRRGCTEENG